MSDSRHTPGPWTISQQKGLSLFIIGNDEAIAEVLRANFNQETFANADLIRAAPELLEALKQADLQIEYMQSKFKETGTGNSVRAQIAAVIQKVESGE